MSWFDEPAAATLPQTSLRSPPSSGLAVSRQGAAVDEAACDEEEKAEAGKHFVHFGCEDCLCSVCGWFPSVPACEPGVFHAATCAGPEDGDMRAGVQGDAPEHGPPDAHELDIEERSQSSVCRHAALQFRSAGWSVADIAELMALDSDMVVQLLN